MAMIETYNFGPLLLERAKAAPPDAVAVRQKQGDIAYWQLSELIVNFALHMRLRGIGPGSRVALQSHDVVGSFLAMWANALLGSTMFTASKAASREPRLKPTHRLHTSMPNPPAGQNVHQITLDWSRPLPVFGNVANAVFPGYSSRDGVMLISQTSGSTGLPKFIEVTCGNFMARVNAQTIFDTNQMRTSANLFSPLSRNGLKWDVRTLLRQGTIVRRRSFRSWLSTDVEIVIGSPHQITQLLPETGNPTGKRIPVCYISGSHVSPETRRFLFGFFDQLRVGFNSTECLTGIERIIGPEEPYDPRLGKPANGVELQVLDDDGRVLPNGEEGHLRVRSPVMVKGYLFNPEATAQAFRDGWFYPGDIAKLTNDGELIIIGRAGEQFNLGGIKVSAQDIDSLVLSHANVTDAASFVFSGTAGLNKLGLLVVPAKVAEPATLAEELRELCKKTFGPSRVPERIMVGTAVPRNETGKVQREDVSRVAVKLPVL